MLIQMHFKLSLKCSNQKLWDVQSWAEPLARFASLSIYMLKVVSAAGTLVKNKDLPG